MMMITEPADPSAMREASMCGRKTEKHCSFKYDSFFLLCCYVGHCAQVTKGMGKDIHSEIYHGTLYVIFFSQKPSAKNTTGGEERTYQ